jgi:alkaline phosphatase
MFVKPGTAKADASTLPVSEPGMPRSVVGIVLLTALSFASPCALAGERGAGERGTSVIVMIADGGGYSVWAATSMYQGRVGRQVVDNPEWTRLSVSTYPLRTTPDKPAPGEAGLKQEADAVYDPAKCWDATSDPESTGAFPNYFRGYAWNKRTKPDSANTASAIMTGVKSYNGALNVNGNGVPQLTLAEVAKKSGRKVGVVSTVPISHATVAAAGGAHHVTRNAYASLAKEMLNAGTCDVIIGAGNPDFDENAGPRGPQDTREYQYVGGQETWQLLLAGTHPAGWKLIQHLPEFVAMASGPTPAKLLGVLPVSTTAQQERRSIGDAKVLPPGLDKKTAGVAPLMLTARVAVHAMEENDAGFFLMIEGGAVDWAEHANQLGRVIEEHTEFIETLETVSAYLDAGDHGWDWSNTLVIVTADHDHLWWGPNSDTVAYQPLEDRGAGNMPGAKWLYNSHSNQLVPFFARGVNAEKFIAYADQVDKATLADGREVGRGKYLDQTEIHAVLEAMLKPGS